MAKAKHIIVFGVNMDSPKRNQVKIGNTIRPAEDPIKRAVQAEPVSSTMNFQEYQNATDVGTPNKKAAVHGLFDHQSEIYCVFNWNQPITCPKNTKTMPRYRFISASKVLSSLAVFLLQVPLFLISPTTS